MGGFYPEPYCERVTALQTECFQESLLELWANKGVFDETSDRTIASLTKKDIIEKLNAGNYSEFYMKEKNFPAMLSGVIRNGHGEIVSATATVMRWMGRMNATLALSQPADDSGTRGELVDLATDQFEKDLAGTFLKYKDVEPVRLRVEVNVANSFGEIASGTIWADTTNLSIGFSIVFIYVNIMLGKFNHVEQRARFQDSFHKYLIVVVQGYLSLLGLASVAMSIGFSYGLCSLFGLPYGPLHNMIPFLLLGIGIQHGIYAWSEFECVRY